MKNFRSALFVAPCMHVIVIELIFCHICIIVNTEMPAIYHLDL